MADRPPVSVLLPTTRWTDACREVATQLEDHDELLLIHDVESDPITERQHTPEGVQLIAAGEPKRCSGKANAIGGAVIFERDDIDEAVFVENLQRTVSDDGLLMEYLQVTTVDRTRIVPIGGTIRETVERQVRWTQILRWHFPGVVVGTVLVLLLVLTGAIVAPLPTAVLLTAMHLAGNEMLGIRRWTAVLAYPLVFVFVSLSVYALTRRTFVWGGRRYRWRRKFDVTVLK